MEIGSKIKKIRELKGFSQQGMSDLLLISQNQYNRIENNEVSPTFKLLENICIQLEVTIQELLEFDLLYLFNNYNTNQSGGKFIAYNNTEIEYIEKLYKERITELKDEVSFLRSQLTEFSSKSN